MIPFNVIVAVDSHLGIGKKGVLPWYLSGDMKHFKQITSKTQNPSQKNVVIMGRKTWESLPEKFRPLPGRINFVLTRNKNYVLPGNAPETYQAVTLNEALIKIQEPPLARTVEAAFVIGGGEVFKEALQHPGCQKIYMTHIVRDFKCDIVFPEFKNTFKPVDTSARFSENSIEYYFSTYLKKKS